MIPKIECGYDACVTHMALRQHMTSKSYDFFKYNGRASMKFATFEKRNDRYYYDKVYKFGTPFTLLLANVVVDPSLWVGDIVSEQGMSRYYDYVKRNEGLTYLFQNDIMLIDEHDAKSAFVSANGQLPKVIVLFLQNKITFETLCLLTELTKVFRYWTRTLSSNYMAEDILFRIERYTPFINADREKISRIFLERFSESA